MPNLSPEEIWSVLQEQAREDALFDEQVRDIAALSDDAVDDELRRAGYELADVEKQAAALLPHATQPQAVSAVEQKAAPRSRRPPRRRPVVLWVAAAAAAVTVGGGLIYAATHRPPPPPPPVPEPTPSTPEPLEPLPTDLVAAADLRTRAAGALDRHQREECLQLLDEARALDPAGDKAPDVVLLRKRALTDKPPR